MTSKKVDPNHVPALKFIGKKQLVYKKDPIILLKNTIFVNIWILG